MEINGISAANIPNVAGPAVKFESEVVAESAAKNEKSEAPVKDKANVAVTTGGATETFDEAKAADKLIEKAVEQANKKLKGTESMLAYGYHKQTNRIHVKVLNAETKEVIREIPPEKALDAFAKMLEMAGLLVDKKN